MLEELSIGDKVEHLADWEIYSLSTLALSPTIVGTKQPVATHSIHMLTCLPMVSRTASLRPSQIGGMTPDIPSAPPPQPLSIQSQPPPRLPKSTLTFPLHVPLTPFVYLKGARGLLYGSIPWTIGDVTRSASTSRFLTGKGTKDHREKTVGPNRLEQSLGPCPVPQLTAPFTHRDKGTDEMNPAWSLDFPRHPIILEFVFCWNSSKGVFPIADFITVLANCSAWARYKSVRVTDGKGSSVMYQLLLWGWFSVVARRGTSQPDCQLRQKFAIQGLTKDGDLVLGGIFHFHVRVAPQLQPRSFAAEPPAPSCEVFDMKEFQLAQTMIFAIEEINNSTELLPNITLGYKIYDGCNSEILSVKAMMALISLQDEAEDGPRCKGIPTVPALLVDAGFIQSLAETHLTGPFGIPMSCREMIMRVCHIHPVHQNYCLVQRGFTRMLAGEVGGKEAKGDLAVYKITRGLEKMKADSLFFPPRISFSAVCQCFSNKEFMTLFQMVPNDSHQIRAITLLVKYFGWNWVGLIKSSSTYISMETETIVENLKKDGICIGYKATFSATDSRQKIRQIVNEIKQSSTQIIISFATLTDMEVLLQEVVYQNVTGIQWIGSESWITTQILTPQQNARFLRGALGFVVPNGRIPALREFLLKLNPFHLPRNPLVDEFWERMFGCTMPKSQDAIDRKSVEQCNGKERLQDVINPYTETSQIRSSYSVYNAVFFLAQAIHNLLSCGNNGCTNMSDFEPQKLLQYLEMLNSTDMNGNTIHSHQDANVFLKYELINWQVNANGVAEVVSIGKYDGSATFENMLKINVQDVVWSNGKKVNLSSESLCFRMKCLHYTCMSTVKLTGTDISSIGKIFNRLFLHRIHFEQHLVAPSGADGGEATESGPKGQSVPVRLSQPAPGAPDGSRYLDAPSSQTPTLMAPADLPCFEGVMGGEGCVGSQAVSVITFPLTSCLQWLYIHERAFYRDACLIFAYSLRKGSGLKRYIIYRDHCLKKACKIIEDPYRPAHSIFQRQLLGKSYRRIRASTTRLRKSFFPRAPRGRCTSSCFPGTRKEIRPGEPICCFDCVPCHDGVISNVTDSLFCIKCPLEYWPNENRTECVLKDIQFLSFEDGMGVTLASFAIGGACLTIAMIGVFYKYRHTPLVRANNLELSFYILISLDLCFLCALAFISRPSKLSCVLRFTVFGVTFAMCLAGILGKTMVVLMAFKTRSPTSHVMRWFTPKRQRIGVLTLTFAQCTICILWIIASPPYPFINVSHYTQVLSLECQVGSDTYFWGIFTVIFLLTGITLVFAFFARKLPDSFNEATHITFSLLTFCAVWITFFPVYVSAPERDSASVQVFAILASSFSLLLCIFAPKCYIILFKPELNSKKQLLTYSSS
ncbi:vomeronasal type-2 receptor 1-like [Narcine bancroftii]|uniref:vomeronasal type-2 receptor 1-like n=1 Tax=Narcine bancroftii TaxID=1343680 RepID=UPI003831B7CF